MFALRFVLQGFEVRMKVQEFMDFQHPGTDWETHFCIAVLAGTFHLLALILKPKSLTYNKTIPKKNTTRNKARRKDKTCLKAFVSTFHP